jgi:hypothetical protein
VGWMPGVIQRPVPSHSGLMIESRGLVLHVQVGNGSCYGEFSNPANEASSTWWIAKDGTIEQYVDDVFLAWTEANGNPYWDSVETEGVPGEPLTDAQVLSLARIYIYGVHTKGWTIQLSDDPNTHGLGWHGMGGADWGGHFGCPGDLRKAQRPGALWLVTAALYPPAVVPVPKEESMLSKNPRGGFVVARPNGSVYCESAPYFGSVGQVDPKKAPGGSNAFVPSSPVVSVGCTQTGLGYWLLGADGSVYAFGDAPYLGPNPGFIKQWGIGLGTASPLVGIVSDGGGGYDLVADNTASPAPALYHLVPGAAGKPPPYL